MIMLCGGTHLFRSSHIYSGKISSSNLHLPLKCRILNKAGFGVTPWISQLWHISPRISRIMQTPCRSMSGMPSPPQERDSTQHIPIQLRLFTSILPPPGNLSDLEIRQIQHGVSKAEGTRSDVKLHVGAENPRIISLTLPLEQPNPPAQIVDQIFAVRRQAAEDLSQLSSTEITWAQIAVRDAVAMRQTSDKTRRKKERSSRVNTKRKF